MSDEESVSAEVEPAADEGEADEAGEQDDSQPIDAKSPKQRGVVFLSRLPIGMKPSQLKQYMMEYGKVQRMWCVPIDKSGKKATGRMPMEAWIEFKTRKRARRVAEALNCSPVGRGRFKEELWNIRYLKGFTWQDLMGQQLHHKKLRDQRLRQRVDHAKKSINFYLNQKEKQDNEERKSKKRKNVEEAPEVPTEETAKRTFSQTVQSKAPEELQTLDDDFLASLLGGKAPAAKRAKTK